MFDKEMLEALAADAEKLEQLTGENHEPLMLVTCENCGGEGWLMQKYWIHDPYPYAVEDSHEYKCPTCGGSGLIGLTIAETLEIYEG